VNYRWSTNVEGEHYRLLLLIDGHKYEVACVEKSYRDQPWVAFVSGFVDEEQTPVEGVFWEHLHEAKSAVLTFIKVWWVTGAYHRMNDKERESWREYSA
jgi:hypothetical protein